MARRRGPVASLHKFLPIPPVVTIPPPPLRTPFAGPLILREHTHDAQLLAQQHHRRHLLPVCAPPSERGSFN